MRLSHTACHSVSNVYACPLGSRNGQCCSPPADCRESGVAEVDEDVDDKVVNDDLHEDVHGPAQLRTKGGEQHRNKQLKRLTHA